MQLHAHPFLRFSFALRLIATWVLVAVPVVLAAQPHQETRHLLEQWVEARRAISAERARWQEEQIFLQQSLEWMETELNLLSSQINEAEETASTADERRRELQEQSESLARQSQRAAGQLAVWEDDLRSFLPALPPPLTARVQPLMDRMGGAAEVRLPQRIQTLVAALTEINRFNRTVTLSREVRVTADNRQIEVQTLYLGLAQAYFVNEAGSFAGSGRPGHGGDGWEWTIDASLARPVARAIEVYQNERPAEFLPLPVKLR
jgi:septal ring factor EnvC (AmiA/AmiB activator)